MQDFMKDRYGADELTTALGMGGMLLALAGSLFQLDALMWVALAIVVVALARALSKNADARSHENHAFLSISEKVPGVRSLVHRLSASVGVAGGSTQSARTDTHDHARADAAKAERERAMRTAKKMWSQRKTSRFLKCPTCGQVLSVPKGKGKIRVTCPKCHTKMETTS